jgi:hypothetical protein
MWKKLYQEMTIQTLDGELLPKPTEKDIVGFENSRKTKLPVSCREYVKTFGIGELRRHYRIAAPLGIASNYNLEQYDRVAHGEPEEELWSGYAAP